MAEDDSEKTEQATDTRREEFRKQGQVAHTRELGTALVLLVASGLVYGVSRFFFQQILELFNKSYGPTLVELVRHGNFLEAFQEAGLKTLMLSFPVILGTAIIGSLSSILQIGFLQVEDAFSLDFNKLNPVEGFGRLFSIRSLVEGLKSLAKITVIGFAVYFLLKGEIQKIPSIMTFSVEEILVYIGSVIIKLLFGVGILILILASADYFFQRWDLEKKMMMTKQEVKEETKQREGDPMIKARIRRIQRDMANRRMMDKIPKADVVITNPTHIAVVLKYDENLPAPQLVAKGADLIAEKIKAIARENNIPVIENKPLARTIYKTLKLGQVIPRELFVAVAEVLSYVYKLRRKVRK